MKPLHLFDNAMLHIAEMTSEFFKILRRLR